MSGVTKVDGAAVRELLDSSEGTVVIDFFADWCAPCRAIGPGLADLAQSNSVPVLKVDVDEDGDLAQEFGVRSIPTVVRFDSGVEHARSIGFATPDQLAARLGFGRS